MTLSRTVNKNYFPMPSHWHQQYCTGIQRSFLAIGKVRRWEESCHYVNGRICKTIFVIQQYFFKV